MFLAVGYAPISYSAPRPLGPLIAYVSILLSEAEQDRALCDGEGERAYVVNDPILGEEKYLVCFKLFAGAKTAYGTICRKTVCRNPFCRTWRTFCRKLFSKLSLSQFSANCPVSEELLKRWKKLRMAQETQKFAFFACATSQVQDTLTPAVSFVVPCLWFLQLFGDVWPILDLFPMYFSWTPVFGSREYVGSHRNLRIRFYRLVGRVRTLRVPARRFGALTEEPPVINALAGFIASIN